MRTTKTWPGTVIVLLIAGPLLTGCAQDSAGRQSPPTQEPETPPGQPAQTIQTLSRAFAGTWTTSERYEASERIPNGGTGRGEVVWRPGPGGFTLLQDYHAQTPLGELFGFGLLWWDHTKGLQHIWCINVSPTGCEIMPAPPLPGPEWNGTELVIDTEIALDEKKYIWHEVISDITPTSYVLTVDIGESAETLERAFTVRATRVNR